MGVNNCGHCVGGVMKPVDKLECEGYEKRGEQQKIRPSAAEFCTAQVASDVESHVAEPANQRYQDNQAADPGRRFLHLAVEERCS